MNAQEWKVFYLQALELVAQRAAELRDYMIGVKFSAGKAATLSINSGAIYLRLKAALENLEKVKDQDPRTEAEKQADRQLEGGIPQ